MQHPSHVITDDPHIISSTQLHYNTRFTRHEHNHAHRRSCVYVHVMYGMVNVMICDVMIVLYDWCDYVIITEMMRSYLDDMGGPSCGWMMSDDSEMWISTRFYNCA